MRTIVKLCFVDLRSQVNNLCIFNISVTQRCSVSMELTRISCSQSSRQCSLLVSFCWLKQVDTLNIIMIASVEAARLGSVGVYTISPC